MDILTITLIIIAILTSIEEVVIHILIVEHAEIIVQEVVFQINLHIKKRILILQEHRVQLLNNRELIHQIIRNLVLLHDLNITTVKVRNKGYLHNLVLRNKGHTHNLVLLHDKFLNRKRKQEHMLLQEHRQELKHLRQKAQITEVQHLLEVQAQVIQDSQGVHQVHLAVDLLVEVHMVVEAVENKKGVN